MLKAALERSEEALLRDRAAPAIRLWATLFLGDGRSDRLRVSEAVCADPDCPPIETILAFEGGVDDGVRVRIPRPMRRLGPDDVAAALRPIRDGVPPADPSGSCC